MRKTLLAVPVLLVFAGCGISAEHIAERADQLCNSKVKDIAPVSKHKGRTDEAVVTCGNGKAYSIR